MALVALDGTPLVALGMRLTPNLTAAWLSQSTTLDAANEAIIMYGQIFTADGGSHTIDTTGSSALAWLTGTVTFSNAGTTVKVGLATMDTATGPPGRATNATDVITFSVSKSMTGGGGGVTNAAWQSHVPDTGSLSVANGDFIAFCVQMTARGGSDSVVVSTLSGGNVLNRPSVTSFTGGAYASVFGTPNCLITFSDGTLGWFAGSTIFSALASQTWGSGSNPNEYGNYLQFPFPLKVYGIFSIFVPSGDNNFVLYSDPLGTPVAEKTVSVDANAVAAATARPIEVLFASPYTTTASQPLAVIAKPGATTVTMTYKSFDASAHQVTEHCGTNGYAVRRVSGSFTAQNSNKDRFPIGLLVGAFDTGGSAGRAVQVNNDSVVA